MFDFIMLDMDYTRAKVGLTLLGPTRVLLNSDRPGICSSNPSITQLDLVNMDPT